MKWWLKGLIGTGVLIVLVAIIGFGLHRQIVKTSTTPEMADARDDKMGTLCGEIFGGGMVAVWFFAYKGRDSLKKHIQVA
jgi:hypothetical protein